MRHSAGGDDPYNMSSDSSLIGQDTDTLRRQCFSGVDRAHIQSDLQMTSSLLDISIISSVESEQSYTDTLTAPTYLYHQV